MRSPSLLLLRRRVCLNLDRGANLSKFFHDTRGHQRASVAAAPCINLPRSNDYARALMADRERKLPSQSDVLNIKHKVCDLALVNKRDIPSRKLLLLPQLIDQLDGLENVAVRSNVDSLGTD